MFYCCSVILKMGQRLPEEILHKVTLTKIVNNTSQLLAEQEDCFHFSVAIGFSSVLLLNIH